MLYVLHKADKQTMFNYMIKSDQDLKVLECRDEHEDKVTQSNRQDNSDSNKVVVADSEIVEERDDEKNIKNRPHEEVPVTEEQVESDTTDTPQTTDNSTQAEENKEQRSETESGPIASKSKQLEQNGKGNCGVVKEIAVFETVVERVKREWEARGITEDQYNDIYKTVVANFSTQQVPTSLKQVGHVVPFPFLLSALPYTCIVHHI